MNLLQIEGLSVFYEGRSRFLRPRTVGVWALRNISFSLRQGESLSVVGESGSGKTTLLRSILGLVPFAAGDVALRERSLAEMSGDEKTAMRRKCGYVPQDPYASLPPTLSVLGAVVEPWLIARGRGDRDEGVRRAKELLSELKLPESLWGERVRYSLSGGQRQRVAIARALILDPELLLCDEPTAMQDVSTRDEVLEVLGRRIRAGMSLVLVTHDLFLARYAAPRGLVLYKGEIVESGSTSDLLEKPTHSYTKALLAALPRL